MEGGVVPGGVFDDVFVAAGEVAGGDVFCFVGPGGGVVVGEGDHEVAEDVFAGADGDAGFVAGEDGGGDLVGVEGAVVEVWAVVAGEGVLVDGVEGVWRDWSLMGDSIRPARAGNGRAIARERAAASEIFDF